MTLLLVNTFPARRARDILMLMGLLFAASLVIVLRFIRPEQLLRVESLPDLTDFFATLQSPVTPLLPSFWAGETIFASLAGGHDLVHAAALWTTAMASIVVVGAASERWYFSGYSRSQEAPKARFTHFRALDVIAGALPLSTVRRQLLVKDLKIFLRDVSQWSQLLLLLALVLLYLYNFSVLDLQRIPYMSGYLKNVYALLNLAMAGFVMATVAVRFVFPAVSSEGAAFWIIRTSPLPLRDFLWSKFWTGLVPVLALTEVLTIAANQFLGVDPLLKVMAAAAIVLMSFALVGLAVGLGARYPRFGADPSQAAGSYGGVAFMMQAVLFIIVIIVLRRLALVGLPASSSAARAVHHRPAAADAGEPGARDWTQPVRLAVVDALRGSGARRHGSLKRKIVVTGGPWQDAPSGDPALISIRADTPRTAYVAARNSSGRRSYRRPDSGADAAGVRGACDRPGEHR